MAANPDNPSDNASETRVERRSESAATRSGRLGTRDSVNPLIAEIRGRLAELAARELTLQQREQELEHQYRLFEKQAWENAQREWSETQARLRKRSAELDAQAVDLAARRSAVDDLEQRLSEQQLEQERAQQEITEQASRLRRRAQSLQEQRRQEHDALRRRIGVIRESEKELERRIGRARHDIVQQRHGLEQEHASLEQRVRELEKRERELKERKTALEQEVAGLQARAGQLNTQHTELQAAAAELERRQRELTQQSEALDAQRRELADRQRDFDLRWRSVRERGQNLADQTTDLDARRRMLDEREGEIEQRMQRLEAYEEQLRGRAAALEAELQRVRETEQELENRHEQTERRAARLERSEHELERQKEELQALRDEAEAREAQARQQQLALELEQTDVAKRRSALEQQRASLEGRQAKREVALMQLQTSVRRQSEALRRAQRAVLARPGRWWLRAGLLGAAMGVLAGIGWLALEKPVFRAESVLAAPSDEAESIVPIRVHAQRLQTADVVQRVFQSPVLTARWMAAVEAGRAHVVADEKNNAVVVRALGPERHALRDLTVTLTAGYVDLAPELPADPLLAEQRERWKEERAALVARVRDREQERERLELELAARATPAARDALQSTVNELQAQYAGISNTLASERVRLADLEAGPVPRGNVTPATLDDALAADDMIQEDQKEFRATAVQYRSEAAVAMLLLVDPLAEMRRALDKFAVLLADQRELQPPPDVEQALEATAVDVSATLEELKQFAGAWNADLDALQALDPVRDVVKLVQMQHAGAEQARAMGQNLRSFVEDLRARFDKLGETATGGTREIVVAAVLRSELVNLEKAVTGVIEAASNTDLSKNFRLDALDRQLRGLRTRLDRRRETLAQMLQFDADERARREHGRRISDLREQVQELEAQRDRIIGELTTRLDELRRVSAEAAQRVEAEARMQALEAEMLRVDRDIVALDRRIAAAEAARTDSGLVLGAVDVDTISGANRHEHALVAGVGAFALTCLLSLLTVVRLPFGRDRGWQKQLAAIESDVPDATADESPETRR